MKTSPLDRPQTIYVLRAPNARLVRYVGHTSRSAEERLAEHLDTAFYRVDLPMGQTPVARWIRRLAAAHMVPQIEVVSVMPARYCRELERRLIQRVYAGPWLLNVTHNYWWQRRKTMVPRIGLWVPIQPKTRRTPTGRIWRPRP